MSDLDEKIRSARARVGRAYEAGAMSVPHAEWERIVAEAVARVRELHPPTDFSASGPVLPSPSFKFKNRVVPEEYVAIRAEYVLGIERRLAELEERCAGLERSEKEAREFAGEFMRSMSSDLGHK